MSNPEDRLIQAPIVTCSCGLFFYLKVEPLRWCNRLERSPRASGRLDVRILAATDLSPLTGSDISTAKRSAIGVCVCHGSSEMTIINVCPVSQYNVCVAR